MDSRGQMKQDFSLSRAVALVCSMNPGLGDPQMSIVHAMIPCLVLGGDAVRGHFPDHGLGVIVEPE